jgi:hypothetical protein
VLHRFIELAQQLAVLLDEVEIHRPGEQPIAIVLPR